MDIRIDDRYWQCVPVGGVRAGCLNNEYPDYIGAILRVWTDLQLQESATRILHTVEVWAYTTEGNYNYTMTEFCVEGFVTEFISDPDQVDLTNVDRIQILDGNRMLIENMSVSKVMSGM